MDVLEIIKLPYDATTMDTQIITHLAKPMECAKPKYTPYYKNGLWVIMMCQCRFIDCYKFTTVMEDEDNGGGCIYM